ncbi:hypothetical protein TNCV_1916991 [Trichonephila clavipes]|uniref:Uncharacterized protein n=1 Tax=Trichonephila clavipes TaxID=2585209 RepID=A0A8X6W0T4_TRICX|nr:hypothetical protein TNCV_1916991 [Trichonephila clavipes]
MRFFTHNTCVVSECDVFVHSLAIANDESLEMLNISEPPVLIPSCDEKHEKAKPKTRSKTNTTPCRLEYLKIVFTQVSIAVITSAFQDISYRYQWYGMESAYVNIWTYILFGLGICRIKDLQTIGVRF